MIITGKDRGKKGKTLQVLPTAKRVVVENTNLRKKNVRPKKAGEKGQIVEFPAPIDISNVKMICPKCQKAVRVNYLIKKDKKVRICNKCKAEL